MRMAVPNFFASQFLESWFRDAGPAHTMKLPPFTQKDYIVCRGRVSLELWKK